MKFALFPTTLAFANFLVLAWIFVTAPSYRLNFDDQSERIEQSIEAILVDDSGATGRGLNDRELQTRLHRLKAEFSSLKQQAKSAFDLFIEVELPLFLLGLFNLVAWIASASIQWRWVAAGRRAREAGA